jgi:hypothetical protein
MQSRGAEHYILEVQSTAKNYLYYSNEVGERRDENGSLVGNRNKETHVKGLCIHCRIILK